MFGISFQAPKDHFCWDIFWGVGFKEPSFGGGFWGLGYFSTPRMGAVLSGLSEEERPPAREAEAPVVLMG